MSRETFSLQFGYKQNKAGELEAYDAETKMITGDENIVLTDLVVQWKITEPNKFYLIRKIQKEYYIARHRVPYVLLSAVLLSMQR